MPKFSGFIFLLIFLLCYSFSEANTVDSLVLKRHVYRLTHTKKARNYSHPEALEEASLYIRTQLDSMGLKWRKQHYYADSVLYHNVVVTYGDTSLPRLVIGAHYDVCMDLPGADDNASGVAGLLELARLLNHEKPGLKNCIEMVFYTLEEPPYFRTEKMGSYIHAADLAQRKVEVSGMISLEMIGFYSEKKGSQNYPVSLMKLFYPSKGNFIAVVGKKGMKRMAKKFKKGIRKNAETGSEMLIAPAKLQGVDFSDHLNYWLFGFKAIMITDSAFLRNKNYHRKTDTYLTLNYGKMSEVVNGIFHTLKKNF